MTHKHSKAAALAVAAALTTLSPALAQLKAPGGSSRPAPVAEPQAGQDKPAEAKAAPEMEEAARTAAMGWLLLLDRRDWGTAWDTSAAMFRGNVPLATWMDGIPKVRQPLGELVDRKPVQTVYKTRLEGRPEGHYVTVVLASRFEKKSDAQEVVTTVREPDGRWRVTGYSVR